MRLIFNELCLKDIPMQKEIGKSLIEQFIMTYSDAIISEYNFSRSILTCVDLNLIELAKDYFVYQWRNNVDRDIARRFSGMCDRQEISDMLEDEVEFSCCKGLGRGLLTAHLDNELLISLLTDTFWGNFIIDGDLYDVTDDSITNVKVFNLTNKEQLNNNRDLIAALEFKQIKDLKSGANLIPELKNFFPYLIFHKNSLDQLKNEVEPEHIPALCKKLSEINQYFSEWDGGVFEPHKFRSKISPQSQVTLKMFRIQHTFTFDHKEVLVSFHLRYTGNIPGRIYFSPDNSTGKGLICSLTTKLPTVSDRK